MGSNTICLDPYKKGAFAKSENDKRHFPRHLQAEERGLEQILTQSPQEEPTMPTGLALEFGLLASRTVRQYISVVEATQFVTLCYSSSSKLIHLHRGGRADSG